MPLDIGQVLQQRYRIVKLLGQGGFGAVYQAWDLNLERRCALKENLTITPDAQRQFSREATLLANLSHPNLPRVIDHFLVQGQGQYLVMDFIEGDDLRTLLDHNGRPLSETQALTWTSQILDALDYLHRQKPAIIHRDIKPANIKITPEGRGVLVDFGIAKAYNPGMQTTMGARAVTPGYSPPEQYGQGATDARSDLYALGATLYNLLTGQDPVESVQRSLGVELQAPRTFNPLLSANTEAAILRAMQLLPAQRFATALEFKNALSAPIGLPQVMRVAPTRQAQPLSTPVGTAQIAPPRTSAQIEYPAYPPPLEKRRASPWAWIGVGGAAGLFVLVLLGAVLVFWLRPDQKETTGLAVTQTFRARSQLQAETPLPTLPPPTQPPSQPPPLTLAPSQPPLPTATPLPTIPPPPTFTPTPALPAVIVEPYCSMFNQSPVKIQRFQPVTLWWRWDAATIQQVEDHLASAVIKILLDGVEIQAERTTEIEYLKDKGWYRISWYAPVGVLSPGTHRAERYLSWSQMISDGWNTFGPGGQTETEYHFCEIIVP